MHRLVPTLVDEMGEAYPELRRAQASIVDTLRQEEERFRTTLGRGMSLLDEATGGLTEGGDVLAGETAFKLYDTYGFPLDLTQDAVRGQGLTVDTDGFDAAMDEQREHGARALDRLGPAASASRLAVPIRDRLGATDFTGYDAVRGDRRRAWPCVARRRAEVGRGAAQADRRGAVRPHPLLRRGRRPGRRHRRGGMDRRRGPRCSTPEAGRRPATSTPSR